MTTFVYFDGSFSDKTKEMHSAIVCDGDEVWSSTGPNGTSSTESEWRAALDALDYVADQGLRDVVLVGDSRNVIDAMRNEIGTGHDLDVYRLHAEKTAAEIGPVRWEWISSDDNPAGELLRRLARQGKLGPKGLFG